jgi:hypothetical protein
MARLSSALPPSPMAMRWRWRKRIVRMLSTTKIRPSSAA